MPPGKTKASPKRLRATERQFVATDYSVWKKMIAALLAERGGRPTSVPEREWRRLYLEGLEPREALPQAEAYHEHFIRRPIPGLSGKRR